MRLKWSLSVRPELLGRLRAKTPMLVLMTVQVANEFFPFATSGGIAGNATVR